MYELVWLSYYSNVRDVINMLYPSIDKLLTIVDSKYKLVHVASSRSKQMLENHHYQMAENQYKNKRTIGRALEELEHGLIKVVTKNEE